MSEQGLASCVPWFRLRLRRASDVTPFLGAALPAGPPQNPRQARAGCKKIASRWCFSREWRQPPATRGRQRVEAGRRADHGRSTPGARKHALRRAVRPLLCRALRPGLPRAGRSDGDRGHAAGSVLQARRRAEAAGQTRRRSRRLAAARRAEPGLQSAALGQTRPRAAAARRPSRPRDPNRKRAAIDASSSRRAAGRRARARWPRSQSDSASACCCATRAIRMPRSPRRWASPSARSASCWRAPSTRSASLSEA